MLISELTPVVNDLLGLCSSELEFLELDDFDQQLGCDQRKIALQNNTNIAYILTTWSSCAVHLTGILGANDVKTR